MTRRSVNRYLQCAGFARELDGCWMGMSLEEIAGIAIVGMVMLLGLIGTCVPGIPGAPLILAGAIGHKVYFADKSASYFALALLLLLTILSLVLDFLASVLGAKKLGATWRGMAGAVIGGVVGLFFGLPGIILGPIVGAFAFEFAGGRAWKESAQAGAGAMLGLMLGVLGKVICCVIMIAIFFLSTFYNTLSPPPPLADTVVASLTEHAGNNL
jgi:uncharacterized protein YqgC (DUF456 family)